MINIPNFTYRRPNITDNGNCFFDYLNYDNSNNELYTTTTAVKYPKLQRINKIIWKNGKIEFYYDINRNDAIGEKALTKIEVKDRKNNTIKTYTFHYSYFQSKEGCNKPECKRLKLNRIYKVGKNGEKIIYRAFKYYYNHPLPKRTSLEKDYLGYYNNNGYRYDFDGNYLQLPPKPILFFHPNLGINTILPFPLSNHAYYTIPGDYSLLPNEYSLSGLLKQIYLPTGGTFEFEYETPKFNFLGEEYTSGGVRIKKQIINNASNQTQSIMYLYEKSNHKTTGYVNNIPVFGYPTNYNYNDITIFDKSRGGLELTDNNFIGYDQVTKLVVGKGKTIYNYTSPRQYPNIHETRNTNNNCGDYLIQNSSYPNLNYIDKDILRGKLISKTIYDDNNQLLKKIHYKYKHQIFYTYNLNYKVKVFTEIFSSNRGEKEYFEININSAINIERNLLTKKITKEYFANREKTTITKYKYDNNYPFIKEIELIDDVSTIKSEYYYPFDNEVNNEPYINQLITQNRISEPIMEKKYSNGNLVSISKYNYDNFGIPWGINSISKKSLETGKNENMLLANNMIDLKDVNGNIIEFHNKGDLHYYLIWGYNSSKLIAKINNFSNSNFLGNTQNLIETAINASDIDDDNMTDQPNGHEKDLWVALNNLRNALPDNTQMTFYTYDPLVGVTSITDPKGDTQFYIYDSFNRLKQIKDKDGHILKEYEYHYKPFPIPLDNINIEILNHDVNRSTVSFKVNTNNNNTYNYHWNVMQNGTIINGQDTDLITVQYQCRPNLNIPVSCEVADANYPDNNITINNTFNWEGCINGGNLDVSVNYTQNGNTGSSGIENDDNGNGDNVSLNFSSIDLNMNLNGGQGNYTYKWYYIIANTPVLFETTNTNHTIISNTHNQQIRDVLCGNLVKFKCEVTDILTGQIYEKENDNSFMIVCNN